MSLAPVSGFAALMKQRADCILDRLAAAPIITLHCVVDASGAGASQLQGEALRSLTFTSTAWRAEGGTPAIGKMTVRKRLERDEVDSLRAQLPPLTVVRLRAHWIDDPEIGGAHALLVEVLPSNGVDPDLERIAETQRQPVAIQDEILGMLSLDRRLQQFRGKSSYGGHDVSVAVDAASVETLSLGVAHLHALWGDQAASLAAATECAARDLLRVMNDSWLDADESELGESDFKLRLSLQAIEMDAHGRVCFSFGDGGMFAGHSVSVHGTVDRGFDRATLVG